VIHVSTVTQFKQNGIVAIIGGALSTYWISAAQSALASTPQSSAIQPALASSTPNAVAAQVPAFDFTASSPTTKEERHQAIQIMIAPVIKAAIQSSSAFQRFQKGFQLTAQYFGGEVGTAVRNPQKPANKPGRKRVNRFKTQHDNIHGKRSKG